MDTKETITWLKIMRANLKEFPEISNSKKIEALSNAIDIVEDNEFISNNATNGDIIKALFPNMYIEECDYDIFTTLDGDTRFTYDWWNAPYKPESEG